MITDDSIFLFFFKLIELLFTEILPRKILCKKSALAKIYEIFKIFIFSFFVIFIIIAIIIVVLFIIKNIDNFIFAMLIIALSIILTVAIVIITLIFSIYSAEFFSLQDEIDFVNENNFEKHTIRAVLKTTSTDLFVLADFYERNEIRPAIFTKKDNSIRLIDLRIKTTYYKKLYLEECNDEYIRIRRLENKTTKTKMILFASTANNLQIRINDQLIPKIDCGNNLGNFSIYGAIENNKGCNINTVNINNCNYQIIETPVKFYFINKNEL